ncbi:M56 family metallopeptidase [Taibaiella helva]|uniref:M56 family metallopeptidase n=1 Tax=Taibaiella helva TaxID=2301235 RepID=UPI000E56B96C|nr:M56 family metallopeptidase [Taibaiella helva]
MNIPIFPHPLVQALYLTLAHSLWQGLLLAAVTGLIILGTRRAPAVRRYNLLTAALLLFVAGSVITFIGSWSPQETETATTAVLTYAEAGPGASTVAASGNPGWVQGLIGFCNRNAGNIVLFWLAVVGLRSLTLIAGVRSLRRLRLSADFSAEPVWAEVVRDLAARTGVRQAVRLAESAAIKVPMAMGHLKPLILLPVGLMTALPMAEIEAILLHELAHIRRRDYLVNLLQRFTETLFFFNPAVWWLSSLMRAEREHCCDDITLTQVGNKKHYINALVSCQEYVLQAPSCAVALSGGKNNLLHRVKRMINHKNPSLNLMEKSLLTICLLGSGLLMMAFSGNPAEDTAASLGKEALAATVTRQTQSESVTSTSNEHRNCTIGRNAGADKQPQDEDISVIDPVQVAVPCNVADVVIPHPAVRAAVVPEAAVPQNAVPAPAIAVHATVYNAYMDQQQDEDRRKAELAQQKAEEARRQADQARRRADEARQQADEARLRADDARHKAEEAARRNAEEARRHAEESRRQAEDVARRNADEARHRADEARRQADEARRRADEDRRQANEQRRQSESASNVILNGLIKDGIIGKNDSKTSFKLSGKEFIVNGVKQPQPIFQRYRDTYLKTSGKTGSGSWSVQYKHSKD